MPLAINGVRFHPAAELARDLGITRQTLWRWRKEGVVPLGQSYRNRMVLFTDSEADAIRLYATRLTPAQIGTQKETR